MGLQALPVPLRGVLQGRQGARHPNEGTRWPTRKQKDMLHEKYDKMRYKRLQRLGEGAVGIVYRAVNDKDGNIYALKDIEGPHDLVLEQYHRAVDHRDLMCGNDHVVRYYEVYMHEPSNAYRERAAAEGIDNPSRLSISMDFSPEGDLATRLRDSDVLTEIFILKVAIQVLDALLYMCSNKTPRLHMDVKPENILVFNNGAHFKVCDFDASRCLDQTGFSVNQATTEEYRAPEVESREFSPACDVFSLGVVLFLLAGLPDFPVLEGKMLNSQCYHDHDQLTALITVNLSERTYLTQTEPPPQPAGNGGAAATAAAADDEEEDMGLELRNYTPELIALICRMLHHDPKLRPPPRECYTQFNDIYNGLREGTLKPNTIEVSIPGEGG